MGLPGAVGPRVNISVSTDVNHYHGRLIRKLLSESRDSSQYREGVLELCVSCTLTKRAEK